MAYQFSYTVKARLGGTFGAEDEVTSEEEGIDRARDRLWSELQELALHGSYDEFKNTFDIVVEECEPLPGEDQ